MNAAEITGKENLSSMDYIQSTASGVLSGMTGGLIDAKTMYNITDSLADTLANVIVSPSSEPTAEEQARYKANQEIAARQADMHRKIAEYDSVLASSQREEVDVILAKQMNGEQLTHYEKEKLNMFERDENRQFSCR